MLPQACVQRISAKWERMKPDHPSNDLSEKEREAKMAAILKRLQQTKGNRGLKGSVTNRGIQRALQGFSILSGRMRAALLRKRISEEEGNVVLVNDADAYNTSKMCPRCGSKVSDHQGQYRKRVYKACSAKEGIYFTFDRDVGAAVNFCTIDDFRMDPSNARREYPEPFRRPPREDAEEEEEEENDEEENGRSSTASAMRTPTPTTTRRRKRKQNAQRGSAVPKRTRKTKAEIGAAGKCRGASPKRAKRKIALSEKKSKKEMAGGSSEKVAKRRKRTRSTSPQRRKSARLVAKINPEKEMRPKTSLAF